MSKHPNQDASRDTSSGPVAAQHLQVRRQRGIAVVDLLDRSIVDDAVIDALDAELVCLLEKGETCLAINFDGVAQMSSRVIGTLVKCFRTCQSQGGAVKVFSVGKGAADAFSVTNFHRLIDFHDNEAECIASEWPVPSAPAALLSGLEIPPVEPPVAPTPAGSAPAGLPTPESTESQRSPRPSDTVVIVRPIRPQSLQTSLRVRVRLTLLDDDLDQARTLELRHFRFVIGRDPACHLRARSALVSRVHALIEIKGTQVYLRDLGSSNGTQLNDRRLQSEQAEIADGDQIQVGPLRFAVAIEPAGTGPAPRAVES